MMTPEHLHELFQNAIQYARERDYDNGGTGFIGMKPTKDYPVISVEMWQSSIRYYYTVVYLLSDESLIHTVLGGHVCKSYEQQCEICERLREEHKRDE